MAFAEPGGVKRSEKPREKMKQFTIRCTSCGKSVAAKPRKTGSGERYAACVCGAESIIRGPQREYREIATKLSDRNIMVEEFNAGLRP
jgi:predicted RNA-binding Zn-ribbon protein involved in translation (DUF1610 family)